MPPKTVAALILFVLLATVASAQQPVRRITLDGQDGVSAPTEEVDSHGFGLIHQISTPALEIFPSGTKPSHGTVMISPGGAYSFLTVGKEGREAAKMLNAAGWDAAVLLYPVSAGPDTRSLALDAAEKAWTLLQKRGGEFGLSSARIGAMGFSAGGHLTARLAHENFARGNAPAFLVLIYPAYLEKEGKLLDDVTPPPLPVFLCVGDKDKIYYPSSEAYAAACKEKGIHCDYMVAKDAGHGFGLTPDLPAGARDWPDRLKAFLSALPPDKL